MANTYELIQAQTLSSSATSVTFSSIPSTYTDLLVKASIRNTIDGDGMYVYFNSITSGYSTRQLFGTGTSANSNTPSQTNFITLGYTTTVTANTFGNMEFYVPNYAGSNNKSLSGDSVQEGNQTQAYMNLVAGLMSNTAAISTLIIGSQSGSFVQYSSFYLYGIKNS